MDHITDSEREGLEDHVLEYVLKWLGAYAEFPQCHQFITRYDVEQMVQALHNAADRLPLVWDCHVKGMPLVKVDFTD